MSWTVGGAGAKGLMLIAPLLMAALWTRPPASPAAVGSHSTSWLYSQGREAYESGRFVTAARWLTAYVERNPPELGNDPKFAQLLDSAIKDCEGIVDSIRSSRDDYKRKFDECRGVSTIVQGLRSAEILPGAPPAAKPTVSATAQRALAAFAGEYSGRDDGRKARLRIERLDPSEPRFKITLVDEERKLTLTGTHDLRSTADALVHAMYDVELRSADGKTGKTFRVILQHTWNRNYLTAVSVWNGREYGASFQRDGSS